MPDLLTLPWLRQKSTEAAELLADRSRLAKVPLAELARIAEMRLDDGEVRRLSRAALARRAEVADARLTPVRLCVALQSTADFLTDELVVAGLRFGLYLEIVPTEFNQLAELAFGSFFDTQTCGRIDLTFV